MSMHNSHYYNNTLAKIILSKNGEATIKLYHILKKYQYMIRPKLDLGRAQRHTLINFFKIGLDISVATNYHNVRSNNLKRGENVAAMKKGTKLTDTPKDYMLRVRMDEETLAKLDACCKSSGMSRSAIVRQGIEEQYLKMKK